MTAPASTTTQAVAPGDLAYMTAHHGTAQEDFVAAATTRAQAQFAKNATETETAQVLDGTKLTAIAAALVAAAGAKTGAQMATLLGTINTHVVASGRTGGVVTYSGS